MSIEVKVYRALTKEERDLLSGCQLLVKSGVGLQGEALERVVEILGDASQLSEVEMKVGALVELPYLKTEGDILKLEIGQLPKGTKAIVITSSNGAESQLEDDEPAIQRLALAPTAEEDEPKAIARP